MDSAVLLDLLGNENRRRILRLLAHKPCYVTEISEYLGVSPKAVIDHLRKLEEAGMVESHTDDQRRKYFHISRDVRLEVNVSRYGFGAKSAYPASSNLELSGCCRYLSVDTPTQSGDSIADVAAELAQLEALENELSLAQRYVRGRLTDALDRLNDRIGADADSRFYAEVLSALASDERTIPAVARRVEADPAAVERALEALAERNLVERRRGEWYIVE